MHRLPALLLSFAVLCAAAPASAQDGAPPPPDAPPEAESTFLLGRVLSVIKEERDSPAGFERIVQTLHMEIIRGPEKGTQFAAENGILNGRAELRLQAGDRVVVEKLSKTNGDVLYIPRERYRLPSLLLLVAAFFLAAFAFGGRTGLRATLGLLVSIAILMTLVLPQIMAGRNPLLVSVLGAVLIACTSLYLAHGFHRRTSVALLSTVATLLLSTGLAVACVRLARLFGVGTEESVLLQYGQLQSIDLRGLLLGGIIIGALGVLDDITTAQTAAVDEIRKANPSLSFKSLHRAGLSVGREHIASLINTLALAYVGASLPLLLLFQLQQATPVWVILNSEFIAEEVIRTLVGSLTLLLAVPIATWLAARLLAGKETGPAAGHVHFHGHGREPA